MDDSPEAPRKSSSAKKLGIVTPALRRRRCPSRTVGCNDTTRNKPDDDAKGTGCARDDQDHQDWIAVGEDNLY